MKTILPENKITETTKKIAKILFPVIIIFFLIFSRNTATMAGNFDNNKIMNQKDSLKNSEKVIVTKNQKDNQSKKGNNEKTYLNISIDINY